MIETENVVLEHLRAIRNDLGDFRNGSGQLFKWGGACMAGWA
jgi:hypothetical protein